MYIYIYMYGGDIYSVNYLHTAPLPRHGTRLARYMRGASHVEGRPPSTRIGQKSVRKGRAAPWTNEMGARRKGVAARFGGRWMDERL